MITISDAIFTTVIFYIVMAVMVFALILADESLIDRDIPDCAPHKTECLKAWHEGIQE